MKRVLFSAVLLLCLTAWCGAAEFQPPVLLKADGKAVRVESPGYAAPCWADIDGKHFHAIPSPVVGTLTERTTQVGSAGSFEINWQATFGLDSFEQTLCEIVSGTGAYAGLHGTGRWSFYRDEHGFAHITCTAMVHFERG